MLPLLPLLFRLEKLHIETLKSVLIEEEDFVILSIGIDLLEPGGGIRIPLPRIIAQAYQKRGANPATEVGDPQVSCPVPPCRNTFTLNFKTTLEEGSCDDIDTQLRQEYKVV